MSAARPTLETARDPAAEALRGTVALLFVQLFFGLFPLFGKLATREISPRAIAAWRIVVGALVLLAVAGALHGKRCIPRRADLLRLQVCSLLGVALNMVLYLEGLERSTAVHAGLLVATIPVFTFAAAVLAGQERFEAARGAGILLAFLGVGLIVLQKGPHFSVQTRAGDLLMAINAACYSVFLVAVRPLLRSYPPLVVIAWVFALSLWTVPLFAWDESFAPAGVSARGWLSLGYVLVFATILTYLLNTFALSKVSASTTATFIFLQPLIAVACGVLVLKEPLPVATVVAGALTLVGVWLVARRPQTARIAASEPAR
jgi:drug/metabolite transporter (DMT)-like permease